MLHPFIKVQTSKEDSYKDTLSVYARLCLFKKCVYNRQIVGCSLL